MEENITLTPKASVISVISSEFLNFKRSVSKDLKLIDEGVNRVIDWTALSAYHEDGVLDDDHINAGRDLLAVREKDRKKQAEQQKEIIEKIQMVNHKLQRSSDIGMSWMRCAPNLSNISSMIEDICRGIAEASEKVQGMASKFKELEEAVDEQEAALGSKWILGVQQELVREAEKEKRAVEEEHREMMRNALQHSFEVQLENFRKEGVAAIPDHHAPQEKGSAMKLEQVVLDGEDEDKGREELDAFLLGNVKLETPRLMVRLLESQDSDRDFLIKLFRDEDFIKWIAKKPSKDRKDGEKYIEQQKKNYSHFGFGAMAVTLKESNEIIGMVTLLQRDFLEYPDVGFAFLPDYRRKGYATEASQALIDWAWMFFSFPKLYGICKPDNEASVSLLKKLGFVFSEDNCSPPAKQGSTDCCEGGEKDIATFELINPNM